MRVVEVIPDGLWDRTLRAGIQAMAALQYLWHVLKEHLLSTSHKRMFVHVKVTRNTGVTATS